MRVKCLAQERNTMSPARARTRSARSGVERANHEATAPMQENLTSSNSILRDLVERKRKSTETDSISKRAKRDERKSRRSVKFAGTHVYTWVERGTVRVKCLVQERNTMSPARARTRSAQITSFCQCFRESTYVYFKRSNR